MQPARRFYVSAKQAGGGGVSARLSCMRRLRCIWARFLLIHFEFLEPGRRCFL